MQVRQFDGFIIQQHIYIMTKYMYVCALCERTGLYTVNDKKLNKHGVEQNWGVGVTDSMGEGLRKRR